MRTMRSVIAVLFSLAVTLVVAPAASADRTPLDPPYTECNGVKYQVINNNTQIQFSATGGIINDYLYAGEEYGLVWVSINRPVSGGYKHIHDGVYNASVYGGTSFKVPGRLGDIATVSITDDENTYTACTSTRRIE